MSQREIEKVARLGVHVAREVHERHVLDHAAPHELPTRHTREFAACFPRLLECTRQFRQLSFGCGSVKLETRVPWIHIEVQTVMTTSALHSECEHIGIHARAVEIADE